MYIAREQERGRENCDVQALHEKIDVQRYRMMTIDRVPDDPEPMSK